MISYRIKSTTASGTVFFSPFVYTKEQARAIVEKVKSWHLNPILKTPIFELIPLDDSEYPKEAVFQPHYRSSDISERINKLEKLWKQLEG